jgi:eukaryotic-like serine/threonine-protein kinase
VYLGSNDNLRSETTLDTHPSSSTLDTLRAALAPDIELLRPLGSGAMGDVYLAREPLLQRLVAVKVLRPEFAADSVACLRFEREAQAAARVAHANVTIIHRVGRLPDGVPFMVMEYVDGRTLADLLAGGPIDRAVARQLLASVASALAVAHYRGVVHRDVRPGNVFIDRLTGRAVLADFGIAALLESGMEAVTRLTAAGVTLGEPRYMSPEQIRGEPVTPQSDIFAFGVLAYETLTGRGPWDASNSPVVVAHLTLEPTPLRELRSDIDEMLASLIQRCLVTEPNRRPLADELAAALAAPAEPAIDDPAADTGAVGLFLHELRRRRVYRVLVGYGAAALAVLGAANVVYDAFDLPRLGYQLLVGGTLAGFPAALVLSWIFDLDGGHIQRTRPGTASGRTRPLLWAALVASVAAATALGWLLLRGS